MPRPKSVRITKDGGGIVWREGRSRMKAVFITFGILPALFILLSGFLIISIAWTHKPISVWEMIKEELRRSGGKDK